MDQANYTREKSFKIGEAVRTPDGRIGEVKTITKRRNDTLVDVEVIAVESHDIRELDYADPLTRLEKADAEREKAALTQTCNLIGKHCDDANTRIAELERANADLQRRLSRPKAKLARKKSRR